MSAVYALAAIAFFSGSLLLLANVRVLRRVGLGQRVRPYVPPTTSGDLGAPSGAGMSAVMAPLAERIGELTSRVIGIRTSLEMRLLRAGRHEDVSEFRLRQLRDALIALGAVALGLVFVRPGVIVATVLLAGVPVLAVLAAEHKLDSEASRRNETLALELPVIAEQLGILLGAGLSLGSALQRIARRSNGIVAAELANVVREVRSGRSEIEALHDWAEVADSPGVDRLVSVLSLHRDASDLGSLISTEARAIRDETHRRLVESIEKRAQLVWIPVTVATLVPGLILIGVPFVSAMSEIAG